MLVIPYLLDAFREYGVKLWLEGDDLHFEADEACLTTSNMRALKENKEKIIRFLKAEQYAKENGWHSLGYHYFFKTINNDTCIHLLQQKEGGYTVILETWHGEDESTSQQILSERLSFPDSLKKAILYERSIQNIQ